MNMHLAPIVIFAFNRSNSLERLINSLLKNPEATFCNIYIFVDGPRFKEEIDKIEEVRNYAASISGFKSINLSFSDKNKGLGPSIIAGVSSVIESYGKAIILEDDLIVLPNFIKYMNDGLMKYKDNKDVFSICAYTNKVRIPANYNYDTYFCHRSSSWGWATWVDRWKTVDWILNPWTQYLKYKRAFNRWGGSDCFGMLEGWKNGKNKSWAIRFCFSQFLQGKVSLFPIKSLVINEGFDGNGTNCKKWSRFKYELMDPTKSQFAYPDSIIVSPRLLKQAMKYNSIYSRIISRIMYVLKV